MNPRERGFLLLTSRLGIHDRNPLTMAQLRTLAQRVRSMDAPQEDRELTVGDLIRLGYGADMAVRILSLLAQEDILEHYIKRGRKQGCVPVTRVSREYPPILRHRLGLESPGCLWIKGDLSVLQQPAVALVGSRELREPNREFAGEVGRRAAEQGLALISGNARGSDREAQDACLRAGGSVVSVVADELTKHSAGERIAYISEDGFDEPFSSQRALSRNRVIHAMGRMVFVAQSDLGKGGTWDGTVKNLQHDWSPVACFRDGSEAACQLEQMGAWLIGMEDLPDLGNLTENTESLFDR